jgi:hypothetical protein
VFKDYHSPGTHSHSSMDTRQTHRPMLAGVVQSRAEKSDRLPKRCPVQQSTLQDLEYSETDCRLLASCNFFLFKKNMIFVFCLKSKRRVLKTGIYNQ